MECRLKKIGRLFVFLAENAHLCDIPSFKISAMKRVLAPKLHTLPDSAIEFYLALRSHIPDDVENYWDLYSSLYPGFSEDDFWRDLEIVTQTEDIKENKGVISVRPWGSGFCEIDTYAFNQLSTKAKCVYFWAFDKLGFNYCTSFDVRNMVKTFGYYNIMELVEEVNQKMKRVLVIDPDNEVIASSIPVMTKLRSGEGLDEFKEVTQDLVSWKAFSLWRSLARDRAWILYLNGKIQGLNARAKRLGNKVIVKKIQEYINLLIGHEIGTKPKRNIDQSRTKFFNSLEINVLTDTKIKEKKRNQKKEIEEIVFPVKCEEKNSTSGVPPAVEHFTEGLNREEIKGILEYNNRPESVDEAIEKACAIWRKRPPFKLPIIPSSDNVWEKHREEKEYQSKSYRVQNWLMAVIRNFDPLPGQQDLDAFMKRIEDGWVSKDGKRYRDESDAARKSDRKVMEKLMLEKNIFDLSELAEKIITFGKSFHSVEGCLVLSDILDYVQKQDNR